VKVDKKKALFIRLDKIGDLVLTLPCDGRVADHFEAHWLIPQGLDFVAQAARPQKNFSTLPKNFTFKNFMNVIKQISQIKPEVSVSFHAPWWINLCLWLCRVPTRGGVLSQWHSYLFLNKGTRQKRSRCEFHEMEYNYILVEETFSLKRNRDLWQPLKMQAVQDQDSTHFNLTPPYVVVHPGMGGSALNWPNERYLELIENLSQKLQVVITGTKSDDVYLAPLKKALGTNQNVLWLDNQLSGAELLNVLEKAVTVVAPSTGVLHLGASMNTPTLGVYSPIQVHSSKRWGPKGEKTTVFSPSVDCPSQFDCLQKACEHYPCMAKVTAKSVASAIPT